MVRDSRFAILLGVMYLGLPPQYCAGQDPPSPIAHYRFNGNAKNDGSSKVLFKLKNTEFKPGGLYLNGIFWDQFSDKPPEGYLALFLTKSLDYNHFTVAVRFKASEFSDKKSTILMGGEKWRWIGIQRSKAGNLALSLNNHKLTREFKGATLEKGKWTVVACSVDIAKRKIVAFVDGKNVGKIDLPVNFQLDVLKDPNPDQYKEWVFTDFSNGHTFHGLVGEFIVYDVALSGKETAKLAQSK
jgi:hypothetical protein